MQVKNMVSYRIIKTMSHIAISCERMSEIEREMQGLDLKSQALIMELLLEIERLKEVIDNIAIVV